MCQELKELKMAMQGYSRSFDPALLSCADASVAVKDAAAIEHMAAAVKALAAARAAEAKTWKNAGHRSAEEELAQRTGTSVSSAREALALGKRLLEQPDVAHAAREGAISPSQASAISDAVDADPTAATPLLKAAEAGGSLADLKNRCAEVKAKAVDREARRAAIHRNRSVRAWTNTDGVWHLHASGNPEDGAQIMAAIDPLADEEFHNARQEGRHEHPDAYRFDALVRLAVNATSAGHDTPPSGDTAIAEAGASDPAAGAEPVPLWPTEGPASTSAAPECDPAPAGGADGDHRRSPDRRSGPGEPSDAGESGPNGGPGDAGESGESGQGEADTPAGNGIVRRTGAGAGRAPKRRGARTGARKRVGAPVKLLIRVDLDAFLRGFPIDGEICDLVGHGPLPMSAVRDLVNNGDAFIAAVLTKGHQLAGVAHLGRKPTAYQKTALEWIHPTCAVDGCPSTARLELDHRVDWADTHITILDWLDALCHHHHRLKSLQGWALVDGIGKRTFVPPTDRRHPNVGRKAAVP